MKVTVLHAYYGCDSGCCGHIIEVDGTRKGGFNFHHPASKEQMVQFAKDFVREELGEEHIADLDWENCLVSEE